MDDAAPNAPEEAITRLYLVTCAQTTLDRKGVFQGSDEHKLSRKGIRHANLLSRSLRDEKIDTFYSSPFDGAFDTASRLAAKHRRGVVKLNDLREMDFGKWTGKRPKDLEESEPDQLVTWQFTPHGHRMPGGETLEEVQARVLHAIDSVLSVERGNRVCVVSHAVPIKTAMCSWMNEDLSIIWFTSPQESTALNVIDFEGDRATVISVGSLEHLGDDRPS